MTFRAVYRNGVLVPDTPLSLAENAEVELELHPAVSTRVVQPGSWLDRHALKAMGEMREDFKELDEGWKDLADTRPTDFIIADP